MEVAFSRRGPAQVNIKRKDYITPQGSVYVKWLQDESTFHHFILRLCGKLGAFSVTQWMNQQKKPHTFHINKAAHFPDKDLNGKLSL